MSASFEFLGIQALRDAFIAGRSSPVGTIEQIRERSKGNALNAWLATDFDRALRKAEGARIQIQTEGPDAFLKRPLLGIPFAAKDLFVTQGVETTAASKILQGYIPPYTATVIQRLEDKGAILLGKLNMDEFAMGGSNENSAFGPVLHPTHPGRVPGGSSGGSAVAVKAGLCSFALGSDTGGSIRLPASYCGVAGFKPTYGRASRFGMIAFASSLDQAGPLAHSVTDVAEVVRLMCGPDPRDSTTRTDEPRRPMSLEGLRIGVPAEYFGPGLNPEVREHVESAVSWFESRGAVRVAVSLPHSCYAVSAYYIIAVCEASSNLSRFDGVRFGSRPQGVGSEMGLEAFYARVRSQFGPEVKRRILLGTFALSTGYYEAYYDKACRVRRKIHEDFAQAFREVDLMMAPVAPTAAYRMGEKSSNPLAMYLNDILTIPVNLAGLPALSVPCGVDREGLPIGLQIIGGIQGDETVLAAGQAWEGRDGR